MAKKIPVHLVRARPPEPPLLPGEIGYVRLRELLVSPDDVPFVPAWASISRTEMVFAIRLEHRADATWRAVVPMGSRFVRTYLHPRDGDTVIDEVAED